MEEILEILSKIKAELGGEKCDVAILTNKCGGFSIQVHWRDGSDYNVVKVFSRIEITDIVDSTILVDHFINWANHQKDAAAGITCHKCGGAKTIDKYFDAGDHFGAGTSPFSEWRKIPCPVCSGA